MAESRNKKLTTKTIIYFIGNFGSKILSLLLVAIYSSYILPNDLGVYDLIITTLSLIQPIILFQMSDGIFRWLIDENNETKKCIYIKSILKIIFINMAISSLLILVINMLIDIPYMISILILLNVNTLYPLFQQVTRGLSHNKLYATVGFLVSIFMFISSIVLIIPLNSGIEGLLISQIISQLIGILIMIILQSKIFIKVFKEKSDKTIRKEIIKYSIPLIPNTICWWIVNASDRYIINGKLGTYYNGIYSMSTKFPTMMTMVTTIFNMSWQESAILEYNERDRDQFYTDIFNKYLKFLFSAAMILIPFTRFLIEKFIDASYMQAWKYSSILYIAAIFNALASFLGAAYLSSKNTAGSFVTTVFAAMINIMANFILIDLLGLYAAALSTLIAYGALFVIRVVHTKKYFKIKYNFVTFAFCTILLCATYFITQYTSSIICLILTLIMCVFAFIYNFKMIKAFLSLIFMNKRGSKKVTIEG